MYAVLAGATSVVRCQFENAGRIQPLEARARRSGDPQRTTRSFGGEIERDNGENAELAADCMTQP
jgi:hypothetical protein